MATSFITPGLIDIDAVTTLGVSVKEKENPVGYFGTGLKYAIAIVLRNGGKIAIWRGTDKFLFHSQTKMIRGKPHELIFMNDQQLGFTTHFGTNWKMWQAFRELYCNTVDEGGETHNGAIFPEAGQTTIVVYHPDFDQCAHEKDKYFLNTQPLYSTYQVDFHDRASKDLYYRGIHVGEIPATGNFRFTPNVKCPIVLTEDRTVRYMVDVLSAITRAVLQSRDEQFIYTWLTQHPKYIEHSFDLGWGFEPGEAFMSVMRQIVKDPSLPCNPSAIKLYARYETPAAPKPCNLLTSESNQLRDAINFCLALGYTVNDYPIIVVESLGDNILGKADRQTKTIYISHRTISMGDNTLVGTLIEEWVHIKHNLDDESRGMQNWLFDQIARLGKEVLINQGAAE